MTATTVTDPGDMFGNDNPAGPFIPDIPDDMDTCAAALAYADAAIYVLPVRRGSKDPGSRVGKKWQTKSTTDRQQIVAMWAGTNDGIALHAGRSGLVIFDVDHPDRVPDVLADAIAATQGPYQSSRPKIPGKGHYPFLQPEGRNFGNGYGRLPKDWGEIRGANGVIIVAPSVHEDAADGALYQWQRTGPIPVLPDSVADLLDDVSPADDAATDAIVEAFLADNTASTRPSLLDLFCRMFTQQVADGASRHTTAVSVLTGAMKEARAGYYEAANADDRLNDLFVEAVTDPTRPGDTRHPRRAASEWSGIRAWAVAQALAADLDDVRARVDEKTTPSLKELIAGCNPDPGARSAPGSDSDTETEDDDDPYGDVPQAWDDANVAEALAYHLRTRWLYVATWGRWLRWDNTRWATDDTEQVHEVARQWVVDLGAKLFASSASADELRRCAGYRNRTRLDAVLTMARRIDGIAARSVDFDQDPDLLNVANGTVTLSTGTLADHDPGHRITKTCPVDYVPGAQHADVDAVLRVVDDDVRPWLQRLVGYSATGHTSEDVVPVADGSGANGKSTLLEALGAVLGDYASAVSPQLVMRTAHDQHPTVKADLLGRRLVWISETEEGGAFRMEQVKALTGGDQISARFMRGDFFTFTPTHTLLIATNHRPAVNSTELAAWRRLRLVPFPFTYKPVSDAGEGDRVQDPRLRWRLTHGPGQREALLAWVIDGAATWYADGLGTCATIDAATRTWRQAEDVILRFIGECIQFDPTAETRGRDLYVTYTDWCNREGRKAKSGKNFANEFMAHETVTEADIAKVARHQVAIYEGVSIRGIPAF